MCKNLLQNMRVGAGAMTLALLPGLVFAQDELNSGDTAWMLTSTALVLFMTIPGLSLFYAGMVRAKNALSVMMQCFAITCLITILWALYAYSLAFGSDISGVVGGLEKAFMAGVTVDAVSGSIPESVFSMFQLTFAVITPALIIGAFAERMKFSALLIFMALWVTVVYAPVCHWVWGGGWLGNLGVLDFAGGTVVHINAGIAGLVAALVMGKRQGYPSTPMKPSNMMLTTPVTATGRVRARLATRPAARPTDFIRGQAAATPRMKPNASAIASPAEANAAVGGTCSPTIVDTLRAV